MRVKREFYRSQKDLPRVEPVAPGSPLCAGCGGLLTLRLLHKVLGRNVVVVAPLIGASCKPHSTAMALTLEVLPWSVPMPSVV